MQSEEEEVGVMYVKRVCVGSVNVVSSTSGFIVDRVLDRYQASLPFFERKRKVLDWNRLLEKYVYAHCVENILKETAQSGVDRILRIAATDRSRAAVDAATDADGRKRHFLLGRKLAARAPPPAAQDAKAEDDEAPRASEESKASSLLGTAAAAADATPARARVMGLLRKVRSGVTLRPKDREKR